MTRPRDTTPAAYAVQIDRLRLAGPEARLRMAAEMTDAMQELAVASIRRRHPDLDEVGVGLRLIERMARTTHPRAMSA